MQKKILVFRRTKAYLTDDAGDVALFGSLKEASDAFESGDFFCEVFNEAVFQESVGTCKKCGSPLFPSDNPEYEVQCFQCDEDFYRF